MPFSPPRDTREKDIRWQASAKVGCRDSRPLWTDYWQRFNTITIPLLDEDAFFSDALAAEKVAQDRRHLEELLEKKSKERRAELETVVDKILYTAMFDKNPFSPEAAWDAVDKVGRSGSLDSFIQLASGIIWGWGERQLGERRPRRERSPSPCTFTETQEMPHMYSPYPIVSDNWDLLHHDMGPSVTELPASPEQRQLPPPTLAPCGTAARVEDIETTDGVGYSALEWSRKPPKASSEMEPAVRAPRESPTMSQSVTVNSSPTDPALPPSPSDARPSLTASQTTPTTPPDPPSDGEVDMPQPLLFTQPSSPQREGGQEPGADACRASLGGKSKPRGKRRFHELEGSDLENAAYVKRAGRELG
ncbi:hypothetical protein MYCTH_2303014 [Thermothelomyces thermophilus ATCC 42464]|uniref:Uncharacterized protein n=1 Tax=Thermothelomyces thermophilus (strain ATCC 42464 / BCRC 31852 / DSM 1799) TaxID=573729 RepID=G2Q979_THET4|nr:uncharacterized protein MYCTH_2303014 [Thermothelomyces thermophilus ATCC 42464]AEO57171.1 hypothetical protein MYCTH_2303014 [Thermothelomyces thermophilus ATCC 42464]